MEKWQLDRELADIRNVLEPNARKKAFAIARHLLMSLDKHPELERAVIRISLCLKHPAFIDHPEFEAGFIDYAEYLAAEAYLRGIEDGARIWNSLHTDPASGL